MAGSAGAVADALAQLPLDEWTVLHDPSWPGRRYASIDHVVIGPPGIFVIDFEDGQGPITVTDGVLRQNGHRRDAVVAKTVEAALAVKQLVVAIQDTPAHAVLCFADEVVDGAVGNAILCTPATIAMALASRPPVLLPAVRADIANQLDAKLSGPSGQGAAGDSARRRTTDRRQAANTVISSIVGASLALGGLGLLAGQQQILDRVGERFASFVGRE